MATISDVAKRAGVSIATVSYVLNGRTDLVREETAERIRRAADELSYSASPMARGLATGSSYTVAVVLPHHYVFSHPIGSQEFLGVAEEFYLSNYSMLIKPSYEDERRMKRAHNPIPGYVAGILVLGPMNLDNKDLEEARGLNKPIVVMEDVPEEWGITCVNADNYRAARIVTEYFLERGHTSIGFICHSAVSACIERRLKGCRDAFTERGLEWRTALVYDVDTPDDEDIKRATEELLDSPLQPTAVVALSSPTMLGVAAAIDAKDVRVPEEIAVGCVDYGMPSDLTLRWPLVTLSLDLRAQGELAARTLIEMLKTKKTFTENRYIMPQLRIIEPS